MKKLLVILGLLTACTSLAFADSPPSQESAFSSPEAQYELGQYYLDQQDYALAFKWLEPAAQAGNAAAQNALGDLCKTIAALNSEYDQEIMAVAFAWYQKALDQDYTKAYGSLSSAYLFGMGVERNAGLGALLRIKALESKPEGFEIRRMGIVSNMLYNEDRGTPEMLEYLAWLEDKAASGEKDAYAILGRLYEDGRGVQRDYAKSFAYYTKAAELGDKNAQKNLVENYEDGKFKNDTDVLLTKAQNGDAQSQMEYADKILWDYPPFASPNWNEHMHWLKLAADQGLEEAQQKLIGHYGMFVFIHNRDDMLMGSLTARSMDEFTSGYDYHPQTVLAEIEKYANAGLTSAQNMLGHMYANGYIVNNDYDKALQLFNIKDPDAVDIDNELELAKIYAGHTDPEKHDYAKAREILESLLAKEHYGLKSDIYYELGRLYQLGFGVPQDYARAASYYAEGINNKDINDQWDYKCEYALSLLYWQGFGVEKDIPKALELMERSAEVYPQAQIMVAQMYFNTADMEPDYIKAYGYAKRAANAVAATPEIQAGARELYIMIEPHLTPKALDAGNCIAEQRPVSKQALLNSLNF